MEDYSERRYQLVEQTLNDTRARIWVSLLTALATSVSAVGLLLVVARQASPSAGALLGLGISVAATTSASYLVTTLLAHERRLLDRLVGAPATDPTAVPQTVSAISASDQLSAHRPEDIW